MSNITAEEISNCSYTDFVGLVNQWNVLPGSYSTLSKWATYSGLNRKSKILEVACTTGFSSRELALMTGCSGVAFDISEKSVQMAQYNKKQYAPNIRIKYLCANGYEYQQDTPATHIIFGAALRFFPDPKKCWCGRLAFYRMMVIFYLPSSM